MHRLHDTLSSLVQQGHIAGAAALVYQRGRVLFAEGVGQRCLERGLPVERDTLFRVASMSKPVTTLAALALYDEGRFDLDDPISRWAPEFSAPRVLRDPRGPIDDVEPARRPITWRDLLTHRSGIPYGSLWPGPLALAFADALGGDLDTPRRAGRLDRRAGLHAADLFRLLRLYRHGAGHCPDVRHQVADEF